jgi:hypothetical protein
MQEFRNYLVSINFTSKKESHFYELWVKKLYHYTGKTAESKLEKQDIDRYIKHITKSKKDWQVKQAQEAIRIYCFWKNKQVNNPPTTDSNIKAQWKTVGNEMINMLRLKQLALQTERTYMHWLRDFYRFLSGKSPYLVDGGHVKNYLTYLAVDRHVAPSTQNQALNALLFFFSICAGKRLGQHPRCRSSQKKAPSSGGAYPGRNRTTVGIPKRAAADNGKNIVWGRTST